MKRSIFKLFVIMKRHPESIVLFVSFSLLLFRLWSSANGSITQAAKTPERVSSSNFVADIFSGSLFNRDRLLSMSEVSLVFYYAPWCKKSMKALTQFEETAKELHEQVSFIAVNCWWPGGECRAGNKNQHFPQIFLHHKLHPTPVYYSGPLEARFMSEFVRKSMAPLSYLTTFKQVQEFLQSSQITVVGHFIIPSSTLIMAKFIQIYLTQLQNFPSGHCEFGVITNSIVASQLGLSNGFASKYNRVFGEFIETSSMNVTNATTDSAKNWLAHDNHKVVTYLHKSGEKSNVIYKVMRKGPTLIAFVSESRQEKLVEEVALKFNQHCHHFPHCWCFASRQICFRPNPRSASLAQTHFRKFTSDFAQHRNRTHSFSTQAWYDSARTRLSVFYLPTNNDSANISGWACRGNMTLQFLVLNRQQFSSVAMEIGLLHNETVAIVDLKNEREFQMTTMFNKDNLENFIVDYLNKTLAPRATFQQQASSNEDFEIQTLDPKQVNSQIINSSKDVLLYYHSHSCGFCSIYSHIISTFKMRFPRLENIKVIQVEEENMKELPSHLTTHLFPTIIIFPGNRTADSVTFSRSTKFTLASLIEFLLHYSSPRVRAELITQACGDCDDNYAVCKIKELRMRLKQELTSIKIWKKLKANAVTLLDYNWSTMMSLSRGHSRSSKWDRKKMKIIYRNQSIRRSITIAHDYISMLSASCASISHLLSNTKDEL